MKNDVLKDWIKGERNKMKLIENGVFLTPEGKPAAEMNYIRRKKT